MKVLLTGCAGFIGASTASLLLDRGAYVVGLDNLNNYYDIHLKQYRLKALELYPAFSFIQIDIEDRDALKKLFALEHFDAVVNLAARAGVRASVDNPHIYLSTNTQGTLNLLEIMSEHGVTQFVMASTSSLYAGASMPFVETANVMAPSSPYAATKLAAEALAHTWRQLHGIDIAILRYFTVYGPAGRPDMSPFRFIESIRRGNPLQLYGDGNQTRDFTFIDDIAAGTVAALQVKGCEVINLGGGNRPLSIKQMIAVIEEVIGKKAQIEYLPRNPVDMDATSANIKKACKILNWTPKVQPQEGFQRTALWHLANTALVSRIKL